MNIKPRHKRRFFWGAVILLGLCIIGIICIPPFINLNKMRPILEAKLYEQTGIQTKINGNINFSLLGSATIVAHDITVPNGKIGSISFSVPLSQMFNLQDATLNQTILVNNANLEITDLFPNIVSHEIFVSNISLKFMNHDYKIIRGVLAENKFDGHIRTPQHKYDVNYQDGEFVIINSNDNLHIRGTLFPDGGAAGEMSIATDDINKWFEFEYPKIDEPVNLTMDFNWDGKYGFDFTNIHANNYRGSVQLLDSGINVIDFNSANANIDLSFIMQDKNMLNKTDIKLNLDGNIKFNEYNFTKFMMIAMGRNNKLELNHVATDTFELYGGTYDNNGLHNTKLQIKNLPEKFICNFTGNQKKWECQNYKYGNITGNISVDNGIFKITAKSMDKMPQLKTIRDLTSRIGDNGTIEFTFSDQAGTLVITKKQMIPKYRYAKHITLPDINMNLKFLPTFMSTQTGVYTTQDNKKTFIPDNQQWMLEINGDNFIITGLDFKHWLPNMDLRFLNTMPYAISGTFSNENISDLNIMLAGQLFTGNATKSGWTLEINELDLDKFINPSFTNNFEEQKFLTNHPLATLFDLPINISLSADSVILKDNKYANFVYSLKPNTQVLSVSDNDRGHLLAIIEKDKFNYDISIQLNKFKFAEQFLQFESPLNIENSTVTAEIKLKTSGQTANDLLYNLNGDMDITFIGGEITGLGFDKFYASADNLSVLNAEYALASALENGKTKIKSLKIVGKYNNGDFETTRPLTISMRHVEGVGAIFINNKITTGTFDFIMRGTAPKPAKVSLDINENGRRKYVITELINNLDIGFMRAFIRTHNKF